MKKRAFAIFLVAPSLAACEAILGLHDHTLRDAGEDVALDASKCDGDFCACSQHAFCDDFDPYTTIQDLQGHWSVPGFTSPILQLNGSVAIDTPTTILPPTRPNALLASVTLPIPLQGAGFAMTQVDAQTPNVVGIHVSMQIHVVALEAADGAPPVLDSGVGIFGGILAIADLTSKNGVGIALADQGGYLGYALDLLTAGTRLAQGKQFLLGSPLQLNQLGQYLPIDFYVVQRSHITLAVDCTPGPPLTDADGGTPDTGAPPADPVAVVVTSAVTAPTCEVLSGPLAYPGWLASPTVILGSVVKGQGVFSVEFDNFTLDFVTQ